MTDVAGMTWRHVHIGDTVRGADQRVWIVCERHEGLTWVGGGEAARFVLRLGERAVSIQRRLDDGAPVVACADHRATAAAAQALITGGVPVELVGEVLMSDPFAAPATPASSPATAPTSRWCSTSEPTCCACPRR